ncbi:hypothetical protein PPERSA_06775 [Pseudocohnilembus persalinus]|uniref:Uncharacterized protein n=1 Tax=Pseudocohnilembus persalinus TaxID=266149 RepID=A0A0V0QT71_PSEPJ|nr:hypothetical protein PPERSA_06775 [Pseudocohnilembus persalinus]|eukprot:KRX05141.1 hypothetical protein PPERSA_06775 [Pseudocohnilembus persalinus]
MEKEKQELDLQKQIDFYFEIQEGLNFSCLLDGISPNSFVKCESLNLETEFLLRDSQPKFNLKFQKQYIKKDLDFKSEMYRNELLGVAYLNLNNLQEVQNKNVNLKIQQVNSLTHQYQQQDQQAELVINYSICSENKQHYQQLQQQNYIPQNIQYDSVLNIADQKLNLNQIQNCTANQNYCDDEILKNFHSTMMEINQELSQKKHYENTNYQLNQVEEEQIMKDINLLKSNDILFKEMEGNNNNKNQFQQNDFYKQTFQLLNQEQCVKQSYKEDQQNRVSNRNIQGAMRETFNDVNISPIKHLNTQEAFQSPTKLTDFKQYDYKSDQKQNNKTYQRQEINKYINQSGKSNNNSNSNSQRKQKIQQLRKSNPFENNLERIATPEKQKHDYLQFKMQQRVNSHQRSLSMHSSQEKQNGSSSYKKKQQQYSSQNNINNNLNKNENFGVIQSQFQNDYENDKYCDKQIQKEYYEFDQKFKANDKINFEKSENTNLNKNLYESQYQQSVSSVNNNFKMDTMEQNQYNDKFNQLFNKISEEDEDDQENKKYEDSFKNNNYKENKQQQQKFQQKYKILDDDEEDQEENEIFEILKNRNLNQLQQHQENNIQNQFYTKNQEQNSNYPKNNYSYSSSDDQDIYEQQHKISQQQQKLPEKIVKNNNSTKFKKSISEIDRIADIMKQDYKTQKNKFFDYSSDSD